MRGAVALLVGRSIACGSNTAGESDTASDTAATSQALATTTTTSTGGDDDWLGEHGPCPNGDECSHCVHSEGASVCGAECYELGPGFARCPESAVQLQSICVWADNSAPPRCLIMCAQASDCPDPGMVCVGCPAPFAQECEVLWGATEKGPNICAWPAA